MDLRELGENLGLELDEFIEIVELFVETASSDIEKIEDALTEKDPLKAQDASHSLKGSAGNLGFMVISGLAYDIEQSARDKKLDDILGMLNAVKLKLDEVKSQLS